MNDQKQNCIIQKLIRCLAAVPEIRPAAFLKTDITGETEFTEKGEKVMTMQFVITEQTDVLKSFAAVYGDNEKSADAGKGSGEDLVIGYGRLAHYKGRITEVYDLWLTEEGKEVIGLREFAEEFFAYLKKQGYEELCMISEDIDFGQQFGFSLEERDASGWYPKYEFRRKLTE